MAQFSYRARDPQGFLVTGNLEVATSDELQNLLASRGLIPLSIKKSSKISLGFLEKIFKKKVKLGEILLFTRQFHMLFKAGMSMEGILGTLIRQTNNPILKESLRKIRSRVSSGISLTKAFAEHQDIFGELYVNMLAAGEEAGILQEVLENLSSLLEKDAEVKASIKAAMLYPKIVIFVLVGAMTVLMMFVVPRFEAFFSHYDAPLPLPTRIMMGISHVLRNYSYIVVVVVGIAWFGFQKYKRTLRGRVKVGGWGLRVPVFGDLNLKVANSRFCHILSALYRSGLPMTRCLEITGGTVENGAFYKDVETLTYEVTKGKSISEGMAGCKYFTPLIVDSAAVGEQTGALDQILETAGLHYDLEVKNTIKNLTTLLEPFLLFMIFGMVALFALSIFLPMWSMSKVVSGR